MEPYFGKDQHADGGQGHDGDYLDQCGVENQEQHKLDKQRSQQAEKHRIDTSGRQANPKAGVHPAGCVGRGECLLFQRRARRLPGFGLGGFAALGPFAFSLFLRASLGFGFSCNNTLPMCPSRTSRVGRR